MNKSYFTNHSTPLGVFTLVSDGAYLTRCLLPNEDFSPSINDEENSNLPVFISAKNYLDAYFLGQSPLILPPLHPVVSPYTHTILTEALNIRYGETISYHELARRLNKPTHARSVGNALGKNPIPLFIPCHRIIKSDHTLGGYTGGVNFKIKLLAHEAKTKLNSLL